jgi:hypothetical protein
MKVSHVEGLAKHNGPESCLDLPQGGGEALTGGRAGQPLSRERPLLRGADAVRRCGRPHPARRYRETPRDSARSETRACTKATCTEPGRSLGRPRKMVMRAASGSLRTHADEIRTREVGRSHSTGEALEQSRFDGCGESGEWREGERPKGTRKSAPCSGLRAESATARCAASASLPEARAGCGNPARQDPWRGLWATIIPAPTLGKWFLHSGVSPNFFRFLVS